MHLWLSQYSTETISSYNLLKSGFRRSCKSTEISLCSQQSFLVYRMCLQSLVLGHTFPKCVFTKRVHQNWHSRLIKLKYLESSRGFNSTCGFLCFQGYCEHVQILFNKVTLTKKISSVVLSLTSGFVPVILKLLLNYMQRWCLFLFNFYVVLS